MPWWSWWSMVSSLGLPQSVGLPSDQGALFQLTLPPGLADGVLVLGGVGRQRVQEQSGNSRNRSARRRRAERGRSEGAPCFKKHVWRSRSTHCDTARMRAYHLSSIHPIHPAPTQEHAGRRRPSAPTPLTRKTEGLGLGLAQSQRSYTVLARSVCIHVAPAAGSIYRQWRWMIYWYVVIMRICTCPTTTATTATTATIATTAHLLHTQLAHCNTPCTARYQCCPCSALSGLSVGSHVRARLGTAHSSTHPLAHPPTRPLEQKEQKA
jgi:hypothetical protein